MALPPLITPAPTLPNLVLVERQQVTTISVVASSTPSGVDNGSSTTEKKGFPVAVAIPALVGGMAAAFGAFGLWWWCTKRNKRQRRERWEAAQRKKQRARANSAGRPSLSSSRGPSATNLKGMAEKDVVPPVPALPKHYPPQPQPQQGQGREKRQSYGNALGAGNGYGGQADQYKYDQQPQHPDPYQQQHQYAHQYQPPAQYPQGYATQPTIDGPISPTYSDHSTASGSGSSASGSASGSGSGSTTATSDPSTGKEPKKVSPTKSGSRSTARVAVADSAAATAGLDANVRYQPKKPSPLALKAQAEKEALAARMGMGNSRPMSGGYDDQEMLAPDQAQGRGQGQGRNVTSGEWGVALGSPNHDPSTTFSFADQQSTYQPGTGGQNRYSNDPYLSTAATANQRAPSGQYSNDPYAGYHDPIVNNGAGAKKSNWV